MKLTVIIPSLQQGLFIKEALDSIADQGIPRSEYEVLVFDGGSYDDTLSILDSHPIRPEWWSKPDAGQAHAVNQGIRQANGEIIAWLNSDDIYYPGALRTVLAYFSHHPDVPVVFGRANEIDRNGNVLGPYPVEPWNFDHLADYCFLSQPAVFFRRSIPDRFGLLDESLHFALDYEYWLRIGKTQKFAYLDQCFAASRVYSETKTFSNRLAVQWECLLVSFRHTGRWSRKWIRGVAKNEADTVAERLGFATPPMLWILRRLNFYRIWSRVMLGVDKLKPARGRSY